MLVETARLWLDLGFYSQTKGGKFCINSVTGPDEYKTVVNNNAYTNLMARENLRYASDTVKALLTKAPDAFDALVHKTALEFSESEAWHRAAENMYVPYDEKLKFIPQDDSFLDREAWDFKNTPRDRYPLLLFYHPLNSSPLPDHLALTPPCLRRRPSLRRKYFSTNFPSRPASGTPQTRHVMARSSVSGPAFTLTT
jgi:trehalose/maltose hydrolase-like predicted phosphorylase